MAYVNQEHDLNMIPGGAPVKVNVSQHDGFSRSIYFYLYSGAEEFAVPSGCTVEIHGIKPDGKCFSYTANSTEGNSRVGVSVYPQMTAVPGRVECELSVVDSSRTLGSANFILQVEKSPLPEDADMSASDLSTIRTAINESKNSVKEAAASAAEAAASAAEAAQSAGLSKASTAIFYCTTGTKGTLSLKTGSTFSALATAYNAGKACFLSVETNEDDEGTLLYSLDRFYASNYAKFSAVEISSIGPVSSATITWTAENVVTGEYRSIVSVEGDVVCSTLAELTEGLDSILAGMTMYETRLIQVDSSITNFSGIANGVLWKRSLTAATLEITAGDGSKLHLVKSSGGWGPLMWENPPLMAGVSYATTEKWQGNTVYCQLINCGTISNGATISISSMQAATIVRYSGTANGTPLPYGVSVADEFGGDPKYFGRIEVNKSTNEVQLFCNTITGTWTVTLWYTLK